MKHLAKTIALLAICCLTFFTACHEDNVELIPENAQSQQSSVKRITLEDLKRNTHAYNKVHKYLREDGIASRAIYNADNDFWIDIDNIIQTMKDEHFYYTFHIFREDSNEYTEYLYLHPQTDNTYLAFLVQCKLTAQELKDMEAGIAVTDIDEKTIYTPLDGFDASNILNRGGLGSFIGRCTFDVIVTRTLKDSEEGEVKGCDKADEDCFYEYSYTFANPRCEYSFSQYVFIDDPGMTNPVPWQGGNGSTDPFNPTNPTLGSLDPQITLTVPSRWFFTELTPEQKAVWQSNNTDNKNLKLRLTTFLTATQYSNESCDAAARILQMIHDTGDFEFANKIIDVLDLHPPVAYTRADYPGKADGRPFEWWKNDNYIKNNLKLPSNNAVVIEGSPNLLELLLFSMYPAEALLHILNSKTAFNKAIGLKNQGIYTHLHNGKADAFRHAYWNALDVADIGMAHTIIFTDAHEWNSNNDPLETAMDNYNNSKGRHIALINLYTVFTTDITIQNKIISELNAGEFKYLSPLVNAPGQPTDGDIIPGVTTIKFTNQ